MLLLEIFYPGLFQRPEPPGPSEGPRGRGRSVSPQTPNEGFRRRHNDITSELSLRHLPFDPSFPVTMCTSLLVASLTSLATYSNGEWTLWIDMNNEMSNETSNEKFHRKVFVDCFCFQMLERFFMHRSMRQ